MGFVEIANDLDAAGVARDPFRTFVHPPAGHAMRRVIGLMASRPDRPAVEEFRRRHTSAADLRGPAFDRRVDVWVRIIGEFDGLSVVGLSVQPQDGLDVVVETNAGRRILGVWVEPGGSGRIADLLTGRP